MNSEPTVLRLPPRPAGGSLCQPSNTSMAANVLGRVALLRLLLDPVRDLLPFGILLAVAGLLAALPRALPPGR